MTAVFCFLLAILLLAMVAMYSSEVKFQGLMLDYAVRFLNENPCTFAYIPLYLLFTMGLWVLLRWQQACFNSWYDKGIGYGPWVSGFWGVLNILEFIWGFQFLRDSCNCVLIQSTSAFPELPLTGTGPGTHLVTPPTRDCSASTGAAWWADLS